MKKFFLLIFIISLPAFAQKATYNWFFGHSAGITFNTPGTIPAKIDGSAMETKEGVASISDSLGGLLFYTNGVNVWNKEHEIMKNGEELAGHESTSQSSIIVPAVASDRLYYIFTLDEQAGPLGLSYSIVDIKADEGRGEIIEKNVFLFAPLTEKLTAARSKNRRDYWIIAREWNSDRFVVFKLTDTGLVAEPDFYSIGSVHTGIDDNTLGYMKTSPDGKRLALAAYESGIIEVFDFDNETGVISNPVNLEIKEIKNVYGLEFSPDATKLYVSKQNAPQGVLQFDLTAGGAAEIINSAKMVARGDNPSALQLGADGKIYVAQNGEHELGAILSPDVGGVQCGFDEKAVDLGAGRCKGGLPNFIPDFFMPFVKATGASTFCEGETILLSVDFSGSLETANFEWSGPGGFSGSGKIAEIESSDLENEGWYRVKATNVNGVEYIDSIFVEIEKVYAEVFATQGSDFGVLCLGESAVLEFIVNMPLDEQARVSSIELKKGDEAFSLRIDKTPPFELFSGDSALVSVEFKPDAAGKYSDDAIIVNFDLPCEKTIEIPLSGAASENAVAFFAPDTVALVGTKSFAIPIYGESTCGDGSVLNCELKIIVNRTMFAAKETAYGDIIERKIDGRFEELTVKSRVSFAIEKSVVNYLSGEILLGDTLKSKIDLKGGFAGSESVNVDLTDGSLALKGCSIKTRLIKYVQPPEIKCAYNPIADEISIETENFSAGAFNFEIYSVRGNKVFSGNISSRITRIDADIIARGAYFIRFEGAASISCSPLLIFRP